MRLEVPKVQRGAEKKMEVYMKENLADINLNVRAER